MDTTASSAAEMDTPSDTSTLESGFTVTIDCSTGNEYDGRLGLRVSAIFVILVGSLLGTILPIVLARSAGLRVPQLVFFILKYFGSGVIIATAFIHLLAPAVEALGSPCIDPNSPITQYPWPEGICLMTVFAMFFVELLASRYDILGTGRIGQGAKAHDPAIDLIKVSGKGQDEEVGNGMLDIPRTLRFPFEDLCYGITDELSLGSADATSVAGNVSHPASGQDRLSYSRDHFDADSFAMQMTALFILEFGVIFHSILIGLALAVSGEEFVVLYIVLAFHQTFEGIGLGSRLAIALWPPGKVWLPYALGVAYALSTPIAIAAGLGVRETLEPGSSTTLIVNGVFDSVSAGILLYTGLVGLMAREFMFTEMRRSGIKVTLSAFACVCVGAGLMALLGKWA